jgi:transcriptional regulator with XRE-family HTH domain
VKTPRLREWREAMGETQATLGERSGVAEHTISRIEHGASLRPTTARKLADALGVAVADLMERPPVPLGDAPQGTGQPERKGPDQDVWGDEEDRPKHSIPKSAGQHYQVENQDSLSVDDPTRVTIRKTSFFELMRELKANRLTEEEAWQRLREHGDERSAS